MPPLFYTDIEPELSGSITILPLIQLIDKSIFARNHDNGVDDQSTMDKATESSRTKTKSNQQNKAVSTSRQSHKVTWQKHYNELKSYKAQNGHCLVPQKNSSNPKLGLWIMSQRRQYALQQDGKKSAFDAPGGDKRAQLLEEIGFVWRVQRRGPRGAYGELRRLKHHADAVMKIGGGDDVLDAVDFEKYMIDKRGGYSEDDMRAAWRRRFELFQ
eukprot:CAMPEP_0201892608 /NCGR_PEP_ID=MMETSP0902-20130614/36840_1 /ASSEMBLY_ACC=CAM_ASM_000551 /TAXON_ID=420261 /ORGANISM="Thalassiosira antarctica, Strain CCMP982" /LENGTH=213 /DNA_ID=CAMNT_0048424119 /DNA_START=104 /DNA_END=745 /DNA_ORIENTATION=+